MLLFIVYRIPEEFVFVPDGLVTCLYSFLLCGLHIRFYDGFDLKTYLYMCRLMIYGLMFCLLLGPPGFNCWISFTQAFRYIYC